jgi:hypothetical protein
MRLMDINRGLSGRWLSRVGRFVGRVGGFVFGVLGDSFVLNVSNVAGVAIDFVVDGLDAAVGQQDAVRTGHDFAVAGLLVAVVVVRRIVLDGVGEVVRLRRL